MFENMSVVLHRMSSARPCRLLRFHLMEVASCKGEKAVSAVSIDRGGMLTWNDLWTMLFLMLTLVWSACLIRSKSLSYS